MLVQVITYRILLSSFLLKSIYAGFAAGFIYVAFYECYIFFTITTPLKQFFPVLMVNLLTYTSLGYCYFHFINLGVTARRVRILIELHESNKGLSTKEILSRYNARYIVEMRIRRLINSGQVIYSNGRYYIDSPVLLLMAKTIITMKLILLGKKSEFD